MIRRSRGRGNGSSTPNSNGGSSSGSNNGGGNGGMNRRPSGGAPSRHQTFDSNGPEIRIRGTAWQVFEKYQALARDAQSAGDRVKAENLLQHAEHYYRIILEIQEAMGESPAQLRQRAQQMQQQQQQDPSLGQDRGNGSYDQNDQNDQDEASTQGEAVAVSTVPQNVQAQDPSQMPQPDIDDRTVVLTSPQSAVA